MPKPRSIVKTQMKIVSVTQAVSTAIPSGGSGNAPSDRLKYFEHFMEGWHYCKWLDENTSVRPWINVQFPDLAPHYNNMVEKHPRLWKKYKTLKRLGLVK